MEEYDLGNNFDIVTNTFNAPVNGIYHFDAQIGVALSEAEEHHGFGIILYRNNTNVSYPMKKSYVVAGIGSDGYKADISTDVKLNAGDKIHLTVRNQYTYVVGIFPGLDRCWFSGRLVVRL